LSPACDPLLHSGGLSDRSCALASADALTDQVCAATLFPGAQRSVSSTQTYPANSAVIGGVPRNLSFDTSNGSSPRVRYPSYLRRSTKPRRSRPSPQSVSPFRSNPRDPRHSISVHSGNKSVRASFLRQAAGGFEDAVFEVGDAVLELFQLIGRSHVLIRPDGMSTTHDADQVCGEAPRSMQKAHRRSSFSLRWRRIRWLAES